MQRNARDVASIVVQRSTALKKELRLRDLLLMQVLLILGPPWVGTAAKQGAMHIAFWALAIVLFYLPLATVVAYLSRRTPIEGGVYQWVKLGLGPGCGFLAAWNLWVFAVVGSSTLGLGIAASLGYAFGPAGAWVASSKLSIIALNIVGFSLLFYINLRGFHVGRWATGAGGLVMIAIYVVLFGLLGARLASGQAPAYPPFSLALPSVSLMGLNLFSKIAVSALSGFEHVPVFAGECRDPEREIVRSTWMAAPLIALLYIVGTGAVLAYTPPEQVDLIGPIPQAFAAGLGTSGVVPVGTIAILALAFAAYTQTILSIAEAARMPMVAGWDNLMPPWFTLLHSRYRTPTSALLVVVGTCTTLGVLSLIGVGMQEAMQTLLTAAVGCNGIYYALMFLVPIIAPRRSSDSPPLHVRLAAVSGLLVTLLSIGFQLLPIVEVASPRVFAAKVGGTILLANVLGLVLYFNGKRHAARRRSSPTPTPIEPENAPRDT